MGFPGTVRWSLVAVLFALFVVGCASKPRDAATASKDGKPGKLDTSGPNAAAMQSLGGAQAAVSLAKANDWIWRDTESLLEKAEQAAAQGDNKMASKLANQARAQAEAAINQYYLEKAKFLLDEVQHYSRLTADQKRTVAEGAGAIRKAQGKKAYDLLRELVVQLRTAG